MKHLLYTLLGILLLAGCKEDKYNVIIPKIGRASCRERV